MQSFRSADLSEHDSKKSYPYDETHKCRRYIPKRHQVFILEELQTEICPVERSKAITKVVWQRVKTALMYVHEFPELLSKDYSCNDWTQGHFYNGTVLWQKQQEDQMAHNDRFE